MTKFSFLIKVNLVIGECRSDDFEYDNYRLNNCSMDDDEIPEEILDEDGEIDDSKLEDHEWSFEIMDQKTRCESKQQKYLFLDDNCLLLNQIKLCHNAT